jgi:SAM-dependent methyltransferase
VSTAYAVAYALHVRPWEAAGRAAAAQIAGLLAREEADRTAPWGRALDLGCGTGGHSVELAQRGWEVTGVDAVAAAVRGAERRAREAGVAATFLQADVTALPDAVAPGVSLFLDVGCFHGLRPAERQAMAAGCTRLAAPDATALLLAFLPGRRGPLPRGASRDEVEQAFAGWELVDETLADASGMPAPLRKAAPRWYRLRRSPAA